tara:strand:+ start:346 stop:564 length:219 start_codon:yes stop_codon:yes gene_type:complete
MPRYAISKISFFDNELTTVIVEAINADQALIKENIHDYLGLTERELELTSMQDLKQLAFDSDSMINVIEIPE